MCPTRGRLLLNRKVVVSAASSPGFTLQFPSRANGSSGYTLELTTLSPRKARNVGYMLRAGLFVRRKEGRKDAATVLTSFRKLITLEHAEEKLILRCWAGWGITRITCRVKATVACGANATFSTKASAIYLYIYSLFCAVCVLSLSIILYET